MLNSIEIKIPGKLILSGEWSVLETGNSCIVLPVNKYLTVKIKSNENIVFHAEDINIKDLILAFDGKQLNTGKNLNKIEYEKFFLAKTTIETTFKFLLEKKISIKNFELSIESEISKIHLKNGSFTKIGLGSSAATVVGIISAILKFHDFEIELQNSKDIIFKLGAIAHYIAQNKCGSGVDIASCTYQQPLSYKRFDPIWLENKLQTKNNLNEIVKQKWPNLEITQIQIPKNLILCACFVGYSASTKYLIGKIQISENKEIIESINNIVKELINIFGKKELQLNRKLTYPFVLTFRLANARSRLKVNKLSAHPEPVEGSNHTNNTNKEKVLNLIKENRKLLKQLNPNLETKELTKLIDIAESFGAAAKFSGAGGGDCAIAVCFDKDTAEKICVKWKQEGFYPIDVFKTK